MNEILEESLEERIRARAVVLGYLLCPTEGPEWELRHDVGIPGNPGDVVESGTLEDLAQSPTLN